MLVKCWLKSQVCLCPWTEKYGCLKGKAAIYGASLLSVCRKVGAHLWHRGPVGSSGIRTQDLQHLRASGRRSNQLSYLLLLSPLRYLKMERYHWPFLSLAMRFTPEIIVSSSLMAKSDELISAPEIVPRLRSWNKKATNSRKMFTTAPCTY